jgi:hypothetical protein
MPTLSKSLMGAKPWFYETVTSGPSVGGLDPAFDSVLESPAAPGKNFTLRIRLRIYYRPIDPAQASGATMRGFPMSLGILTDANGTPQLIRSWSAIDFRNFTNSARRQAALWDSKFWLVPPNEVGWFDVGSGSSRSRHNIKCEFSLDVAPSAYGAHRIIDVVNLATANFFRSWDTTYSSADGTTQKSFSAMDQTGATVNTQQWTVTHEVGHALGLDHIQVLRHHPDCGFAVMANDVNSNLWLFSIPVAARYQGRNNAGLCYGPGGSADAINNIMGQGMRFSAEDAQPWLDRLGEHLNLSRGEDRLQWGFSLPKWTVAMSATLPRVVH